MPPRSAHLPGPAPVTKNVILGACGNCGGAAGCCCALTPDVTPSASAAIINAFDLLISVASLGMIDTVAEFPPLAPSAIRTSVASGLFRQRGRDVARRGAGQFDRCPLGSKPDMRPAGRWSGFARRGHWADRHIGAGRPCDEVRAWQGAATSSW